MIGNSRFCRYLIGPILVIGLSGFSTLSGAQQTMAEGLIYQLKRLGWQTEQTDEGLLVTPPAAQIEAQSAGAEKPAAVDARAGLKARLRELGWQIEESADGTLIFYPPAARQPASPASPVQSAASRTAKPTQEPVAAGTSGSNRIPVEALQAAGWQATQDAGGALLLRPSESAGEAIRPGVSRQRVTATIADDGIGGILDCDSVVLYRADSGARAIDTPAQARAIASGWLARSSLERVQLGRIRRILNLFLVSIVSDTAPYRLRHQVVVRAQDGLLVAVY